jgi:Spy/CpxP family protein refolding chaperone
MNLEKKRRTNAGIVGVWLVLLSSPLLAQQPPGPDPLTENLFPPDLVMSHQKAIGLDEAQKRFVRSEVLKAQSRFTELQWQLQDAMETLVGLLKQNSVDEAQVMAQLDKVLTSYREINRTQIALMVRIKNKLTPEQQTRLRQLRSESAPHRAQPE